MNIKAGIGLICGLAIHLTVAAQTGIILPPQPAPDPCTTTPWNGDIISDTLQHDGGAYDVIQYHIEANILQRIRLFPTDVVVIINGNNFGIYDYQALALHLAQNGFVVLTAEREGNYSTDPSVVVDVLDAAFGQLGIHPDSEVGVIGHSVGGGVVVNGVIENQTSGANYDIEALIGLAPNVEDAQHIDGSHVSDYLLLYGSEDEDMGGTSGWPREAFAAYDRADTEGSTTCTTSPCFLFQPLMERTMVYVHGADHAGFLGGPGQAWANDYLDVSDQFCIGKAYMNGFLRWHMKGDQAYKLLLRGDWTPPSMSFIDSIEVDGLGNPIGTDLRLYTQFSPKQRRSIENFEDGAVSVAFQSPDVVTDFIEAGENATANHFVRHETNLHVVGWPQRAQYQYYAMWVPWNSRNASDFSDFSVRMGQLWRSASPYNNPLNQEQPAFVALYDGNGQFHWERLDHWGDIPRNDRRGASNSAHSAMATIAIPLNEFTNVDLTDIRAVFFAFLPNTSGTVMIDNLEWLRD